MPRDTRTGGVLETMVLPALTRGGYSYTTQVHVGQRLGGRRHMIDALAEKDGEKFLVSSKWQQTGGTAEQKVPFEIVCLAQAIIDDPQYSKAYLILGGEGWTLREFYTSGELRKFINNTEKVEVVTLENFVALANKGKL